MTHPENNPADPDLDRDDRSDAAAARAALRPMADEALGRLMEAGQVQFGRSTRNSLKYLGYEAEEFVTRRATALVVRRQEHLELTYDQGIATLARAVLDVVADLPDWLVAASRLYSRHAGDEDASGPLRRIQPRLPEIENLGHYLKRAMRNERIKRVAQPDPEEVAPSDLPPLSLTLVGHDGKEWERPEASIDTDTTAIVAERMALEAVLAATPACPACTAKEQVCDPRVDFDWWLRVIRSGRPAPQLIELGKSHCPIYQGPTADARHQNFSRNGFHATGTLLHVFAAADDQRVGDPELLDTGGRNHGKRSRDVVRYNNGRATPESRICQRIEFWAGWQIDRLRQGLAVDPTTFPTLRKAA